jgi:hypothetical protein
MSDPSPRTEYTQEIRFAVVMYGGVSLAIYINGIAQELFANGPFEPHRLARIPEGIFGAGRVDRTQRNRKESTVG